MESIRFYELNIVPDALGGWVLKQFCMKQSPSLG